MATKITGTNTAAAPGVTGDDTDTGLFYGTNEIGFSTGGTSRATVDSSGNLNIPNDSGKIRLGTGADLLLFHDGTNSHVQNGTGTLRLRGDSIKLNNNAASENYLVATANGAVDLYYDNSKKFETTSTGATLTGTLLPSANNTGDIGSDASAHNSIWASTRFRGNDNVKLILGDAQDLQIYHDGSNSYIQDSGTGNLILQATDFQVKGYNTGEVSISAAENGAVELYYNNSKKLETTSDGVLVHTVLKLSTNGTAIKENQVLFSPGGAAYIDHETVDQDIIFRTSDASALDTTALTIDASDAGTAIFNHDVKVPDNGKFVAGAGDDLQIYHDGSNSWIEDSGTGNLNLASSCFAVKNAAGTENMIVANDNTNVELYYDNSKKFETQSYGMQLHDATAPEIRFLRTGNSGYAKIYADSANRLYLSSDHTSAGADSKVAIVVDGTERAYWDSEYYVKNGSIVFQTADKGVCLGSTTLNAANTLTDYEDGTWAPTYACASAAPTISYHTQKGGYRKIGKMVYFQFYIRLNSCSGGSGSLTVEGLPFTSAQATATDNVAYGGMTVAYTNAWSGDKLDRGLVGSNGTKLYLYVGTSSGTNVNAGAGNLGATQLRASGFYMTP
jgi:hypothetical protein